MKEFPWNTLDHDVKVKELWHLYAAHHDISPGSAFYRFIVWHFEQRLATLAEVFDSLVGTITSLPGDQSLDHRDAWRYGVIVGWDESLASIAKQHGWSPDDVERLQRYRAAVESLVKEMR